MSLRIGLIVNALAGLGGPTALRGSDGVAERALSMGAVSQACARATMALRVLQDLGPELTVITGSGSLGAESAQAAGLSSQVIYKQSSHATAEDTATLAQRLLLMQVDLLMFAGGDGTARDAAESVGDNFPVLGIPAGVKMYSGVFATTPMAAGTLALRYLRSHQRLTRQCEVMDVDEKDLRRDHIEPSLFGYVASPEDPRLLQGKKVRSSTGDSVHMQSIAAGVMEWMDPQKLYLIGPGSTTWALKQLLDGQPSLLGVDAYAGGKLILRDATASALMHLAESQSAHAIVTCIGGQGHIFGRGNQQFGAKLVRKIGRSSITVLATPAKLVSLGGRPFIADLGESGAAAEMTGYIQVINGYQNKAFYRCESF